MYVKPISVGWLSLNDSMCVIALRVDGVNITNAAENIDDSDTVLGAENHPNGGSRSSLNCTSPAGKLSSLTYAKWVAYTNRQQVEGIRHSKLQW